MLLCIRNLCFWCYIWHFVSRQVHLFKPRPAYCQFVCKEGITMEKYIDGLVQEWCNSIANALELRLSCTNPSIWWHHDLGIPLILLVFCGAKPPVTEKWIPFTKGHKCRVLMIALLLAQISFEINNPMASELIEAEWCFSELDHNWLKSLIWHQAIISANAGFIQIRQGVQPWALTKFPDFSLTFPWPFCGFPWPSDILSVFHYCLNTNFASNLTNHSPKVAITK